MIVGVTNWMCERIHPEDGEPIYYLVWWVAIISESLGVKWSHYHRVETSPYQQDAPEELQRLADRIETAIANGLTPAHFDSSVHWDRGVYETLQQRLGPFGSEWQWEQKERELTGGW